MLPEYCYNKRKISPSGIVIHYVSCINVDKKNKYDMQSVINLFKDLNRPKKEREFYKNLGRVKRFYASAHFVIGRDGELANLVPRSMYAYHAGKSELNGKDNLNYWTIGVELIGSKGDDFTDDQYSQLSFVLAKLMSIYDIPLDNIVGHDEVATPKGRKVDPGKTFDWERVKASLSNII